MVYQIANAKHLHTEKFYQDQWCSERGGQTEVVLPDKARCDCLTADYAVEFDFASKWAEAVGQALYYSVVLHKPAGIVLIMEDPVKDQKYLERLMAIVNYLPVPITVWVMVP